MIMHLNNVMTIICGYCYLVIVLAGIIFMDKPPLHGKHERLKHTHLPVTPEQGTGRYALNSLPLIAGA
jgi:hypothetical protein